MDEPTLRIGIYARISEDRDGHQTATARQLDDCRAPVERRGWEVADIFEDVDISAYSLKATRPEFERLLLALRHGDIDGVVIWKLDRLTRQQRDLVRVMEACQAHKAFLASVVEGIDTRETVGQFVAELLVAQARMESANTSIRTTRKAAEMAKQGRPPGARRCFGYEKGYGAMVPDEAVLIRDARDRIYAGESLNSIAMEWERREVRTREGNLWRAPHLKGLLMLATLSAQREHEGKLYPGSWPAILSPDDTQRLRAILNRNSGRHVRSARKYLLTGFLRCGLCEQRMSARARDRDSRRYVCATGPGVPNCGKLSSLAEPLEAAVAEMVFAAVDGTALAAALQSKSSDNSDVLALVRGDEAALEELNEDYYVKRLLARDEFMSARATLTRRLEANRAKLSRRDTGHVLGGFLGRSDALREAWAAGSLDWRRSVIGALLDRVVVKPAEQKGRKPFDPGRIVPVWRY